MFLKYSIIVLQSALTVLTNKLSGDVLHASALKYSPTAKKTASQKDGEEATGELRQLLAPNAVSFFNRHYQNHFHFVLKLCLPL